VVPTPPPSLPPSTRLDRIISSDDCGTRPPDDEGDVGNGTAATTDDDDRPVSGGRTIFDALLRRRTLIAAVVSVVAFLSPIIMVAIARPSSVDGSGAPVLPGRSTSDDSSDGLQPLQKYSLTFKLLRSTWNCTLLTPFDTKVV